DANRDGLEGRWSSELFASAGVAVAEPDYIGMGAGPGRPQYMVANAEVSASLDLLRAAKGVATRRGAQLPPGVLVACFSPARAARRPWRSATPSSITPCPGSTCARWPPYPAPTTCPAPSCPGSSTGKSPPPSPRTTSATP